MSRHAPRAVRWLIAAVLLLSGVGKLLDPSGAETLVTVATGGAGDPPAWALPLLRGISVAELLLAGWLLSGRGRRLALRTFAAVVALFSAVLVSLPLRGIEVPTCGCFGPLIPDGDLTTAIVRNLARLALTVFGLVVAGEEAGPRRPPDDVT